MTPYDMMMINDCLFFSCYEDNYLYMLDMKSEYVSSIAFVGNEDLLSERQFGRMCRCGDRIVFAPMKNKYICILDTRSMEQNLVKLPSIPELLFEDDRLFFTGIPNGDSVYFFGYSFPGILVFNICNNELRILDGFVFGLRINTKKDGMFSANYYREKNTVFFPLSNSNAVLEFDLCTEDYKLHYVGDEKQRYISIVKHCDSFVLVPRDGRSGSLVVWDYHSGGFKQYRDFPVEYKYLQYSFFRSISCDSGIILLSHNNEINILFRPETCEMIKYKDLGEDDFLGGVSYVSMWEEDSLCYFLSKNRLVIFDKDSEMCKLSSYRYSDDIIARIKRRNKRNDVVKRIAQSRGFPLIKEGLDEGLSSLIDFLLYG